MCHYYQIQYSCGHNDIIRAPCEWRDECMIDGDGESLKCTKSHSVEWDPERSCMTCSGRYSANSNKNAEQEFAHYFLAEGPSPIEIMVRNEAYLRKRSPRTSFIANPKQTFVIPSRDELDVQFQTNEEFLARRHRRRSFQKHLEFQRCAHEIYDIYTKAVELHEQTKTMLAKHLCCCCRDTAPAVEASSPSSSPEVVDTQPQRIASPVALPVQENLKHQRNAKLTKSSTSENLNRTQAAQGIAGHVKHEIEAVKPQPARIIETKSEISTECCEIFDFEDKPNDGYQRVGHDNWNTEGDEEFIPQPLRCKSINGNDNYRDYFRLRREDNRSDGVQSRCDVRPEPQDQDMTSPPADDENNLHLVTLDSPESIDLLMDIKKFLGMPPDASPAWVFGVLARDEALQERICNGLEPAIHLTGVTQRVQGFGIHSPPSHFIKTQKGWNRKIRESFVLAWNSLDWSSRHQVGTSNIASIGEWPDEIAEQHSEFAGAPNLMEESSAASRLLLDKAKPARPPPPPPPVDHLRDLSPQRISAQAHVPAGEESHFSDDSSYTSSSTSSNLSDNFGLELTRTREIEDISCNETDSDDNSTEYSYSPPSPPRTLNFISADSPDGISLLRGLCRMLVIPTSRNPYDVSSYIDNNKRLIYAIKYAEVPRSIKGSHWDRLTVRMETKESFAEMVDYYSFAVAALDWEEIDSSPVPFKPRPALRPKSLEWDDEARAQGLRRKITMPSSSEGHLRRMKGLMEYRVKFLSPLRISYTQCEDSEDEDEDDVQSPEPQRTRIGILEAEVSDLDEEANLTEDDVGYEVSELDSEEEFHRELIRRGYRREMDEDDKMDKMDKNQADEEEKGPLSDYYPIQHSKFSRFDGPRDIPADAPDTPPWPGKQRWHDFL